jgi:hypothetical protein
MSPSIAPIEAAGAVLLPDIDGLCKAELIHRTVPGMSLEAADLVILQWMWRFDRRRRTKLLDCLRLVEAEKASIGRRSVRPHERPD